MSTASPSAFLKTKLHEAVMNYHVEWLYWACGNISTVAACTFSFPLMEGQNNSGTVEIWPGTFIQKKYIDWVASLIAYIPCTCNSTPLQNSPIFRVPLTLLFVIFFCKTFSLILVNLNFKKTKKLII